MNEHLTLACDADGCITDFEGLICKYNRVSDISHISRGRLWRSVGDYDKLVAPFFESLEKMPQADVLVNFIRSNFVNHFILTASGYVPRNGAVQKKNWFRKHYGPELVVKVVAKSGDKAEFATPTTILVDDRMKSITPWVDAGGIGVLHKNVPDTIAQLQEIIRNHAQS